MSEMPGRDHLYRDQGNGREKGVKINKRKPLALDPAGGIYTLDELIQFGAVVKQAPAGVALGWAVAGLGQR